MYRHAAPAVADVPPKSGNGAPRRPKVKRHARAGIRHAEFSPYVRRLLAVPYDPGTVNAVPIRRPAREPLETDGPATCLI